ncbi:MAG TPA: flippase [Ktedonobacterales bacterium]|jgi:O-antigen/teichoic acid export membrane protein|nr:flippase [Ktedonobacterales bacterium]
MAETAETREQTELETETADISNGPPAAASSARHSGVLGDGATKRIAWNSLILSVGRLLSYASGLITTALLTRMLTQGAYGAYTTAFTYMGIVYVVADAGITLIGVREAAREPDKLREWLSTTLSLKLALALLVYGVAVAAIFALPYAADVRAATAIVGVAFFFLTLAGGLDIAYQSRLAMRIPATADVSVKLVALAGVAALFVYQLRRPVDAAPLFYLAVGITAGANLLAFVVRWAGLRRLLRAPLAFTTRDWRRLLALALPMGAATILGQIHYKADVILLGLLRSQADVAVYGVAYKVIDFMLVFCAVFAGMVYPVLARRAEEDREDRARLRAALTRVLNTTIALAAPAAVGTILLAPGILLIVGGGRYESAATVLQLLAISVIFSFVNMIYTYVIIVQNRQAALIWVSVINISANVALNLYAIPRFSYVGSATATDITECLGMLLELVVANRLYRVLPSWRIVPQAGAACLAMAAALLALQAWALPHPGIIATAVLVFVGAAIYGLVIFAVGGVDAGILRAVGQRAPALERLLAWRAAR